MKIARAYPDQQEVTAISLQRIFRGIPLGTDGLQKPFDPVSLHVVFQVGARASEGPIVSQPFSSRDNSAIAAKIASPI